MRWEVWKLIDELTKAQSFAVRLDGATSITQLVRKIFFIVANPTQLLPDWDRDLAERRGDSPNPLTRSTIPAHAMGSVTSILF